MLNDTHLWRENIKKKQIKSQNVSKIAKNKIKIKTEQENLFLKCFCSCSAHAPLTCRKSCPIYKLFQR